VEEQVSRYVVGQDVEVTLKGKITRTDDGRIYVKSDKPAGLVLDYIHRIYLGGTTTVKVADPEGWPPQAGDVWATVKDGKVTEWFARWIYRNVSMVSADSPSVIAIKDLQDKHPVLMRRRRQ
jgi:hypothetical protein